MKIKFIIAGVVFILGVIYLTLPTPATPDLSNAIRSDEPGDTWQHPDQKGFYTNSDRKRVLSEIQSDFSISLFGLKLPSYRLNYRPEEAFTFVRDQLKSYYLEEIVYPLRESLFVNGWEPTHSPIYSHTEADEIPNISFRGIPYISKVTLKPTNSNIWGRLTVWALIFPAVYLASVSLKKSLKNV